jgi:hypothetical protein
MTRRNIVSKILRICEGLCNTTYTKNQAATVLLASFIIVMYTYMKVIGNFGEEDRATMKGLLGCNRLVYYVYAPGP